MLTRKFDPPSSLKVKLSVSPVEGDTSKSQDVGNGIPGQLVDICKGIVLSTPEEASSCQPG